MIVFFPLRRFFGKDCNLSHSVVFFAVHGSVVLKVLSPDYWLFSAKLCKTLQFDKFIRTTKIFFVSISTMCVTMCLINYGGKEKIQIEIQGNINKYEIACFSKSNISCMQMHVFCREKRLQTVVCSMALAQSHLPSDLVHLFITL